MKRQTEREQIHRLAVKFVGEVDRPDSERLVSMGVGTGYPVPCSRIPMMQA